MEKKDESMLCYVLSKARKVTVKKIDSEDEKDSKNHCITARRDLNSKKGFNQNKY